MTKAALLALISVAAFAQEPAIENAKLETRAFAGSLSSQLAQFGSGPFWAGYSEPAVSGNHGDNCNGHFTDAPVRLEGETSVVVLVRMEGGKVDRLRVSSPDCRLDGGSLPFYWITGVPADASVTWLKSQVTDRQMNQAILAIALHAGAAADRVLDDLSSPTQPEHVRGQTAFWLGVSRGANGFDRLKRMLASDPSDQVRGQAIFGMAQSKDPRALKTVIDAARNDRSPYVRQQALFWLAQKAGDKQAADVIHNAVLNDTDRAVKEHAVFALTQLPREQGIPMLIDLVKNNGDPVIRKRALFWLGQSGDPRALDFIAQILK